MEAASFAAVEKVLAISGSASALSALQIDAAIKAGFAAGLFTCVDCGHVSASNEIDHDTPLEQGGKNEQSNYRVRCIECHRRKTDAENRARHGKG